MAFVDQGAPLRDNLVVSGSGMLLLGSYGQASQDVVVTGDLLAVPTLVKARALTSTRVRLEFSAALNFGYKTSPFRKTSEYKIIPLEPGISTPSVSQVLIPSLAAPKHVELVVSEMTQGGKYAVVVNYGAIVPLDSVVVDGDMEAVTTAAWAAGAGATLTKQAGSPGGSGAQVLRVENAGTQGWAYQAGVLRPGYFYKLSAWIRADGATGGQIALGSGTILATYTAGGTAWTKVELYFKSDDDEFQLYKLGGGTGWVEYDDVEITQIVGDPPVTFAYAAFDPLPPGREAQLLSGVGTAPTVVVVVATSPTECLVTFSEKMLLDANLMSPASYVFDHGISVVEVASVELGGQQLRLKTTTQTEGDLYILSFGGLFDQAYNAMASPTNSPMLGFTLKPELAPSIRQQIYLFLIEGLREEDQQNGKELLKRYLEGHQAIWQSITDAILSIPKLWSAEDAPDTALPLLRRIVGWTPETDKITDALDSATLRRLIGSSVALWKGRGPESNILALVQMLTGGPRARIMNYFQFQFILDETLLSMEYTDNDPWVISDGTTAPDPWTYNLRIVDNGDLNRQLVRDICALTRPTNERVEITYLGLLDEFTVVDDTAQWAGEPGTVVVVNGGLMKLDVSATQETAYASDANAIDWTSYVFACRIRGTGTDWGMVFYREGLQDWYQVMFNPVTNVLSLGKVVGGLLTVLTSVNVLTATGGLFGLEENVWYGLQVSIVPTSPTASTNTIQVMLDNVLLLSAADGDLTSGSLGPRHLNGSTVDLDIIELMFLPTNNDFIDINT